MDHGLVALAQQGDQRAFESLTLAHHTRLFRVAHGILRDHHLAEDATQQALLDIWRYSRRVRDTAKFDAAQPGKGILDSYRARIDAAALVEALQALADDASASRESAMGLPTREVVVAGEAIPKGTSLERRMLTIRTVVADATSEMALTEIGPVLGQVAAIDILPDQAISPDMLVSQ